MKRIGGNGAFGSIAFFCVFLWNLGCFVDASSPIFLREFLPRGEGFKFTAVYRATPKMYDEIVELDGNASFLVNSESIENNRLVKAVRNNSKTQAIVVELSGVFLEGNRFGSRDAQVNDLMRNFHQSTRMELKYVLTETDDQVLINEFESRDIAVLNNFHRICMLPFVEAGTFDHIIVVDYAGMSDEDRSFWVEKWRQHRENVTGFSMKKYLRRFSQVTTRALQGPAAAVRVTSENSLTIENSCATARVMTENSSVAAPVAESVTAPAPLLAARGKSLVPNPARRGTMNSCKAADGFTVLFRGIRNYTMLRNGFHPGAAVLVTRAELDAFPEIVQEIIEDGRDFVLLLDAASIGELGGIVDRGRLRAAVREYLDALPAVGHEFKHFMYENETRVPERVRDALVGAIEISEAEVWNPEGGNAALQGFLVFNLRRARDLREFDALLEERELTPLCFRECIEFDAPGVEPLTEEMKRAQFRETLNRSIVRGYVMHDFSISRDNVLNDTIQRLRFVSDVIFRNQKFRIAFSGEEGSDAGGLEREWYTLLMGQVFNPGFALFQSSETNQNAFRPFEGSGIDGNHLSTFSLIGRIIGKGLIDEMTLECHFTRSFYKLMLGRRPSLVDLEEVDAELYKSLCWIADNDVTGVMDETTFTIGIEELGERRVVELKAEGELVTLSEANKFEYIRLVTEFRLEHSIRVQTEAFLTGFQRMIPAELLTSFTVSELERLISGSRVIDVNDWEMHTIYSGGYNRHSQQVQWFWRAVRSFSEPQRRALLKHATGSPSVPLEGFSHLRNRGSISLFKVSMDLRSTDLLPEAHTCFNRLDLPLYESYAKLREKVLMAISECNGEYTMA